MKMAIKVACVAAVCVGVAAVVGWGQVDQQQAGGQAPQPGAAAVVVMNQQAPPTRLEAMLATRGAVIVRGYTDAGSVQNEDGSGFSVAAVELADVSRGQKEYGLVVGVKQAGRAGFNVVTYVDEEEFGALANAMEYLGRMDSTVTQMAGYEGRFKTKGDFEVANFASDGTRMIALKGTQVLPETGQMLFATAYFPLARLADVRQLVAAGRQAVDKAKGKAP